MKNAKNKINSSVKNGKRFVASGHDDEHDSSVPTTQRHSTVPSDSKRTGMKVLDRRRTKKSIKNSWSRPSILVVSGGLMLAVAVMIGLWFYFTVLQQEDKASNAGDIQKVSKLLNWTDL